MRILHINSYYAEGTFYKNLYDEQIKNKMAIDVYVPTPVPVSRDLGIYTLISQNHKKADRYVFYLKHLKIYRDIKKAYKLDDYSVVHAHSLFSNGYVAMRIKQDFGIPYLVAVRDTDANIFFKRMVWLRKLGVEILNEAEKIIFLSSNYQDAVIEKYVPKVLKKAMAEKSEIIPNGIADFWLENPAVPGKMENRKRLKLLFVGLIKKRKNIPTTIRAIKILQHQGYEVSFTIVGKVSDEAIFKQLKNEPFIHYIPHSSREELIEIYRNNEIFVMPSVTETFGLVYPEAMSQGLPVIYTRGQGFDGQFPDGQVGFAVNCDDAEEIAEKIIKIAANYQELSENAVSNANKFRWSDINQKYKHIYQEIQRN